MSARNMCCILPAPFTSLALSSSILSSVLLLVRQIDSKPNIGLAYACTNRRRAAKKKMSLPHIETPIWMILRVNVVAGKIDFGSWDCSRAFQERFTWPSRKETC